MADCWALAKAMQLVDEMAYCQVAKQENEKEQMMADYLDVTKALDWVQKQADSQAFLRVDEQGLWQENSKEYEWVGKSADYQVEYLEILMVDQMDKLLVNPLVECLAMQKDIVMGMKQVDYLVTQLAYYQVSLTDKRSVDGRESHQVQLKVDQSVDWLVAMRELQMADMMAAEKAVLMDDQMAAEMESMMVGKLEFGKVFDSVDEMDHQTAYQMVDWMVDLQEYLMADELE